MSIFFLLRRKYLPEGFVGVNAGLELESYLLIFVPRFASILNYAIPHSSRPQVRDTLEGAFLGLLILQGKEIGAEAASCRHESIWLTPSFDLRHPCCCDCHMLLVLSITNRRSESCLTVETGIEHYLLVACVRPAWLFLDFFYDLVVIPTLSNCVLFLFLLCDGLMRSQLALVLYLEIPFNRQLNSTVFENSSLQSIILLLNWLSFYRANQPCHGTFALTHTRIVTLLTRRIRLHMWEMRVETRLFHESDDKSSRLILGSREVFSCEVRALRCLLEDDVELFVGHVYDLAVAGHVLNLGQDSDRALGYEHAVLDAYARIGLCDSLGHDPAKLLSANHHDG